MRRGEVERLTEGKRRPEMRQKATRTQNRRGEQIASRNKIKFIRPFILSRNNPRVRLTINSLIILY